jgi:hypothetical protein
MAYNTCTEIREELIPDRGILVFDWDNTLKLYDREKRQISSRVEKERLLRWQKEKQCDMYVISAIYPSKINLETLLYEVNKLGLLQLFTNEEDKVEIQAGKFARKGNVIICGYDKAETFLNVTQTAPQAKRDSQQTTGIQLPVDFVDGDVADGIDSHCHGYGSNDTVGFGTNINKRQVVFFDDEEVNIVNFSALVQDSKCFLVK